VSNDLDKKLLVFVDDLRKHLADMDRLAVDRQPSGTLAQTMMPEVLSQSAAWERLAEEGLELGYEFARHGMDLGFTFASRGMELGFEFASKGEAVGPMANRILFMAVQIGVMSDRIGEMADRILFMANKIGEFGDKITYESQLIIYTEQLIINESVLITRTIGVLSDLITTIVAMLQKNDAYLQLATQRAASDRSLELIYENMNLMLTSMHEYSLRVLDKESNDKEAELKMRDQQIPLRESTMSANSCYCPWFFPPDGDSGEEQPSSPAAE
jgi:hypothetical protein